MRNFFPTNKTIETTTNRIKSITLYRRSLRCCVSGADVVLGSYLDVIGSAPDKVF